ncbi:hypothetical protein TPHA_0B00690 [Tetrapisispora phaffii CBS 4417]|uniref:Uncharacterized protein n=1 Tax=Tetrapisispora phaffii (strain ATCC 24235 / CBS 4417 / NBRC 1672 / NRRL Y-8282 / UCD 70-5) TaxID=1071381 RepID=G8BQE4_TETPH|nr:hypothetical protein TPHA_0B00690 [Tetrapisispora phaffii CBS 4417]CCE61741.1 hypothetical protein TPHA_0B00690 [Tetrapisispora phaffii CBS 4417]
MQYYIQKRYFTGLKPIVFKPGSIFSKVDEANREWNIVTARTYDKPLPTPQRSEVDNLVKEMNAMGLGTQTNMELNFSTTNDTSSIRIPPYIEDKTIAFPQIDFSIFSESMASDGDSINETELLKESFFHIVANHNDQIIYSEIESSNVFPNDSQEKNEFKESIRKQNKKKYIFGKYQKMFDFIYIYNNTVMQYYEAQKLIDIDTLFLDFEVREYNSQ